MRLIEMTSSAKPLALGNAGNVKTPPGNVARMESNGWQRATMSKQADKKLIKKGAK